MCYSRIEFSYDLVFARLAKLANCSIVNVSARAVGLMFKLFISSSFKIFFKLLRNVFLR